MRFYRAAFTLIELLIVVAIIGILAAIAVPNFLNAQIRAKVSRAQADLRTIRTAVQAYALDHDGPPANTHPSLGYRTNGYLGPHITTPVAYLTDGLLLDPFFKSHDEEAVANDEQYYTYQHLGFYQVQSNAPQPLLDFYGTWRSCSYGPDGGYFDGTWGVWVYDPSNGLLSRGNIWVSENLQRVTAIPEGVDPQ